MRMNRREFLCLTCAGLSTALLAPGCATFLMGPQEILGGAAARIERYRKGPGTVRVMDARGRPVAGARVTLEQLQPAFLFGTNLFRLDPDKGDDQQRTYQERFQALFNFATLPFYWRNYESQRSRSSEPRLKAMAQWCLDHGIRPKGHPLIWNGPPGVATWVPSDLDELDQLLKERVTEIVGGFRGLIETWDVINEATILTGASRDNPVNDWIKQWGPAGAIGRALDWARAANPQATLLVNDAHVERFARPHEQYDRALSAVLAAGHAFQAVGVQSHFHRREWTMEKVWAVCDAYAHFGRPIHFTEVTVLSGPKRQFDWRTQYTDWASTPEGEARQADYVEQFYQVLFSHPAVAAITWWDLSDYGAWMGAPGGLLRQDLSPKPAYERLQALITKAWRTRAVGKTDAAGRFTFRGYFGRYRIDVGSTTGLVASTEFDLKPGQPQEILINLGQ